MSHVLADTFQPKWRNEMENKWKQSSRDQLYWQDGQCTGDPCTQWVFNKSPQGSSLSPQYPRPLGGSEVLTPSEQEGVALTSDHMMTSSYHGDENQQVQYDVCVWGGCMLIMMTIYGFIVVGSQTRKMNHGIIGPLHTWRWGYTTCGTKMTSSDVGSSHLPETISHNTHLCMSSLCAFGYWCNLWVVCRYMGMNCCEVLGRSGD